MSEELSPLVPKHTQASRVHFEATTITIGTEKVERDMLATWKGWDRVLAIVRKLEPALSSDELGLLRSAATNAAGKNGYAEMCSALRGMGKLPG